jgi:hypothetical protein
VDPLAAVGPSLTTLEPDDLSGWWIWWALGQVWRLLRFLGDAAPWLALAVVVALAGLLVLLRIGAGKRAAARADDRDGESRDGLAGLGLGGSRDL